MSCKSRARSVCDAPRISPDFPLTTERQHETAPTAGRALRAGSRGSLDAHHFHERRILAELEAGHAATQRSLSRDLGIALGLTNLLIRRLVKKGFVKVTRVKKGRFRYLLTPAGLAAKARLTRAYLLETVRYYLESRDRIRERLLALSLQLDKESGPDGPRPVVFYGAGPLAEIAFICLPETKLELVAVVDGDRDRPFFGVPIFGLDRVSAKQVADRPFCRIIVMPSDADGTAASYLLARDVPSGSIFFL